MRGVGIFLTPFLFNFKYLYLNNGRNQIVKGVFESNRYGI